VDDEAAPGSLVDELLAPERLLDRDDPGRDLAVGDGVCLDSSVPAGNIIEMEMSENVCLMTTRARCLVAKSSWEVVIVAAQDPERSGTARSRNLRMNCRPFPSADAVITSMRGTVPITQNSVIQMMKRRKQMTGVKGRVNPHAFRHTFAREFLLNGGDLASVSHMMGHTQLAVAR
jgi:hypothetical protein